MTADKNPKKPRRRGPYKTPGVARPLGPTPQQGGTGRFLGRLVGRDRKTVQVGVFDTAEEAAEAVAKRVHRLNNPEPEDRPTPPSSMTPERFNEWLPWLSEAQRKYVLALVALGGDATADEVEAAARLTQKRYARMALTFLIRERLVWVSEPGRLRLAVDVNELRESPRSRHDEQGRQPGRGRRPPRPEKA